MTTRISLECEVTMTNADTRGNVDFEHNGRATWVRGGVDSRSPEEIREKAAKDLEDLKRNLRRIALALDIADCKEFGQAVAEQEAKEQRRSKAAATRAHNADPWGHKARAASR